MRLTGVQAAALPVLARRTGPVTAAVLAAQTRAGGCQASTAAARQAASGLVRNGLAAVRPGGQPQARYEITDKGRNAVTTVRRQA